jgi:hypothetical protein
MCVHRRDLALMIALALPLAPSPALAQAPDVEITGPAGSGSNQIRIDLNPASASTYQVARRVAPGSFTVQLRIHNMTPWVFAVHADIYFDPAAVSYVSIAPGPGFGSAAVSAPMVAPPPPAAGLRVYADQDWCVGVAPGTQTVATLTFNAIAGGQSGFDVGEVEFFVIADAPGCFGEPCECAPSRGTPATNTSLAKGVLVVGGSTISCLNVNTTGDAPSINLTARNPDSNGALGIADVSLRSAIQIANAVSGGNRPTVRIAGANPVILLGSALPALSDATGGTYIDGTTQPSGIASVSGGGAVGDGIVKTTANNTVRKLGFRACTGAGVRISGVAATGNVVAECRIGTDAAGTMPDPNGIGVLIDTAGNNRIGGAVVGDRNIISGNTGAGVEVRGDKPNNRIEGNFIGLGVTGAALGNVGAGVLINETAGTTIGGTGGADVGEPPGNFIGNNSVGVEIRGGAARDNFVLGNVIGVTPASMPAANVIGVLIDGGQFNTVGGPTVPPGGQPGNLIAFNHDDGISILVGSSGLGISNVVRGNIICDNVGNGVHIAAGADGNTVGGSVTGHRNFIIDNHLYGVLIDGPDTSDNFIIGNYIGVFIDGMASGVGNLLAGVKVQDAHDNFIGDAVAAPGNPPGNVISGNMTDGVVITGVAYANKIRGNLIGTDAAGQTAVKNFRDGIRIVDGPHANDVGGEPAGSAVNRNVISGNGARGVYIIGGLSANNDVKGNYIGTDIDGADALSNGAAGVRVENAPGTTIGGDAAGAGNVISGDNVYGIELCGTDTDGTFILGNLIGTAADGTSDLGNVGAGVVIKTGAHGTRIGGVSAGLANSIAYNGGGLSSGITLYPDAGTGNLFSANRIWGHEYVGIDLGDDGPTENDAGDGDGGPNLVQNFPMITGVETNCGAVTIRGELDSTVGAGFTVEFFLSDCYLGYPEGRTYLGSIGAVGGDAFVARLGVPVAEGQFITATARDSANNTSEFSPCFVVGAPLGDINGDGFVDFADLLILLAGWGEPGPGDLNGNGFVDFGDLLMLLGAWWSC